MNIKNFHLGVSCYCCEPEENIHKHTKIKAYAPGKGFVCNEHARKGDERVRVSIAPEKPKNPHDLYFWCNGGCECYHDFELTSFRIRSIKTDAGGISWHLLYCEECWDDAFSDLEGVDNMITGVISLKVWATPQPLFAHSDA